MGKKRNSTKQIIFTLIKLNSIKIFGWKLILLNKVKKNQIKSNEISNTIEKKYVLKWNDMTLSLKTKTFESK